MLVPAIEVIARRREDTMKSIHDLFREHGLVRARDGRLIGGVVAGLGRRIGLEPWPSRLLFLLALLVIPGSQILLYPILWILMPLERPGEFPVSAATPEPAADGPQSA
jgi:phage shock protein PspC (stress-responsive transcriptional regulator)